jgi:hypothetical protein
MSVNSFILFATPDAWRIGGTRNGAPFLTEVSGGLDAVPAALKSAGHRGESILLALPSAQCLAAPIATAGLPAKDRRRAMAYRLEEKLPIAAEDVVADFIPAPADSPCAFGVCTRTAGLAPTIDALEAAGVAIAAICPAALLALQHLTESNPTAAAADAILWPTADDQLELFLLQHARPHGWYVLPNDPKDLLLHLALEFPPGARPRTIATTSLSAELRAALSTRPDLRITDLKTPAPDLAATSIARAILAGKAQPWIDLRRDALAARDPFRQVRTPLNCAIAAVVLFLCCAIAAMVWRAARYDQVAAHFADDQRDEYRTAFPAAPLPDDVRSRLESEERSLRGLSGDGAAAPPPDEAGLLTLRDLIARLPSPDDLRYRVLELRLDRGRFTLEGQTRAHADADAIAAALRAGNRFDVEPPRTEQIAGPANVATPADAESADAAKGVSFTLTGVKSTPAPRRAAP